MKKMTWGKFFLLFAIGMVVGVVAGLRQPTEMGKVQPTEWGE